MALYCIMTEPLPVCLAQLLSCTELHVSSLSYLVAVLLDLCIQKNKRIKKKTWSNSTIFSRTSIVKKKIERSWTEVSKTNTMETSAREGEGPWRSRPLQKWNDFFSSQIKGNKNFSRSTQGKEGESIKSFPLLVPSLSTFFFKELHQVLQEVLSHFFHSLTFVDIFHQLVQQYVPRCHVQIKLAVLSKKLNKNKEKKRKEMNPNQSKWLQAE